MLFLFVLQVYERAIPAVPKEQRLSILELYVSRATDFFGIAKVRSSNRFFVCKNVFSRNVLTPSISFCCT